MTNATQIKASAQQAIQSVDAALGGWQRASDTPRALLLIPFQLVAPYAAIAIRNFLMLSAIALYTLFIVWRECSQHAWNCWLKDTIIAAEIAASGARIQDLQSAWERNGEMNTSYYLGHKVWEWPVDMYLTINSAKERLHAQCQFTHVT